MPKTNKFNIALIAHDSKKELMLEFCIAYAPLLSQHNLVATGTTARMISEQVKLDVQALLPGNQGGGDQMAGLIDYDSVDLLFFFRDPICPQADEPEDYNLLKRCDQHTIPYATNIGSAEPLIMALQRGDLDWIIYEREKYGLVRD